MGILWGLITIKIQNNGQDLHPPLWQHWRPLWSPSGSETIKHSLYINTIWQSIYRQSRFSTGNLLASRTLTATFGIEKFCRNTAVSKSFERCESFLKQFFIWYAGTQWFPIATESPATYLEVASWGDIHSNMTYYHLYCRLQMVLGYFVWKSILLFLIQFKTYFSFYYFHLNIIKH